jgi:predicted Co/Zn/Cd cation transporter (cation efflux family)
MVNQDSRSLQFAVCINLIMALTGAIASWICNARALPLDGLVSGLNARMILVAAQLSSLLLRPPVLRDPFGYRALETLYTGSRSLLLLGILVFASIKSIDRILDHLHGASVAAAGKARCWPWKGGPRW